MNKAVLQISAPMVQRAAEKTFEENDDIEERLRKCFLQCWDQSNCWLVTGDDLRMRVGIGALLMHYGIGSEEYARIERSLVALQSISAAMSGVPVDLGSVLTGDLVSLLPIYKEVKATKEG